MDINVVKQRLTALQSKPKPKYEKVDTSKIYWRPKVGKTVIRILPSVENKSNPFKEVFVHYGIAKYPMLALTNYGEKDPIVEFTKELKKSNDKDNWKAAKKLEPKMRIYVPVIVRGEEELGTRLWEFGKEIYMELLSILADEDIGDFTDITDGRDITVETTGPDTNGTKFNKSSVRTKVKTSPVTKDAALLERLLNEQPNILTVYPKKSFEDMKTLLQEFLSSEESSASEEVTEEEGEELTASEVFHDTSKHEPKKTASKSFDDLFKK